MARNKILPYRFDLRNRSRKLRRQSTYGEKLLWQEIRRRRILGFQFHRQVPMLGFIVDFYCHELQLALEVDGEYHNSPEVKAYDFKRQQALESHGVKFLRFPDSRMKRDIHNVVAEIQTWIEHEVLRKKSDK